MAHGLLATGPVQAPLWYTIIRGAIIVLSLGVLIAAAYHLSQYDSDYISGDSGPAGFLVFDAIFTWLIVGAMLAFETFIPKLFFRVAFVAALALDAIFWLAAWAWAASWASDFFDYNNRYGYHVYDKLGSSLAAGAALGAFTWILVVLTLIFLVMFSLRDAGSTADTGNAELGTMQTQTHEQKVYDQTTQPPPQQGMYGNQQVPPQNMPPQQQYEQQSYEQQSYQQQQQYPPQDMPPQQHYGQQPPPQ